MTLGGVSASGLGLIVKEMPRFSVSRPTGTEALVPGRYGTLFLPDGGSAPVTARALLLMPSDCDENAVRAWCAGEGDLILSDDPLRKRHVRAQTTFSRYAPNVQLLTMRLTGAPFRVEETPTRIAVSTARTVFSGNGDVPSCPDFEVNGVGTVSLMLNGVTVTLTDMVYGQTVHIDCENRIAYNTEDGSFVRLTLPDGEWPVCSVRGNSVQCAGTVAQAYMWPNWRWK